MFQGEIIIETLAKWYCEDHGIEVWKDIPGLPGYKGGAICGHILSCNYRRTGEARILSESPDSKGYPKVKVMKDGKQLVLKVHRLIASTFLPNPDNLPQVNHKDEDKTNNSVFNLEYCDCLTNVRYGSGTKRSAENRTNNRLRSKPVEQYSLNGTLIQTYPSVAEAKRKTGIQHIVDACSGKRDTAGGYIWKYLMR